jgi:hypothetical protein
MYRGSFAILALLVLAMAPGSATAQAEESPTSFVYATYSVCDLAEQWRLDALVEGAQAKVYDAAVADGKIDAWGHLAHHTGGEWRRVTYHTSSSLDALLDASDAIFEKVNQEHPRAAAEYSRICSAHEDYIWKWIAGSGNQPVQERGAAGFSVYRVCDSSKEERADELVKQVFAPVYDRLAKEGKLASWGWMQHWVGGEYRRLETMTAADHKTLLATRDAIITELREKHPEALDEFSAICGSHQDYMWDIVMEKP